MSCSPLLCALVALLLAFVPLAAAEACTIPGRTARADRETKFSATTAWTIRAARASLYHSRTSALHARLTRPAESRLVASNVTLHEARDSDQRLRPRDPCCDPGG